MLHSVTFSNFRGFSDKTKIDLKLTPKDPVHGWAIESASGQRLTTALAVIGANASGKTTVLQPIAFLGWFMSSSFSLAPDAPMGSIPHWTLQDKPSEFELILDGDDGARFRYRLAATPQAVVSESLELAATARSKFQRVFDRNANGSSKRGYDIDLSGAFALPQEQAVQVRPNVSLISWARQFNVQGLDPLVRWLRTSNLNVLGLVKDALKLNNVARELQEDPARFKRLRKLAGELDFGLADIQLQQFQSPPSAPGAEPQTQWVPIGLHVAKGKRYSLPFVYESSGTQTAFMLLARMLDAIEHGGVMLLDELDMSLHPHLIEPLLELFRTPESNPKGAQVIFTTHAHEVLEYLQKSQVVLVEKDANESVAYRLDELDGVRPDDNRLARYRAGAYGALPRVG